MTAKPAGNFVDASPLANVTVMGLTTKPSTVKYNDVVLGDVWAYDSAAQVLRITGLEAVTGNGAWQGETPSTSARIRPRHEQCD